MDCHRNDIEYLGKKWKVSKKEKKKEKFIYQKQRFSRYIKDFQVLKSFQNSLS